MVNYYFPPVGGIGSIRAAKFAQYLGLGGWEPIVLAPAFSGAAPDTTIVWDERRVVRARNLEFSRMGRRALRIAPGSDPGASRDGVRAALRRMAHRWIYYPDGQIGWYPFAVRAGRQAMRSSPVHAIVSSSFPITAHLVARRLQRDSGLPWIAEFRDPWADVTPHSAPLHRQRRDLEASLVRSADAVVTVSDTLRRLFEAKGARRVEVITNGFDPADTPPPSSPTDFVVTHLGSFYPHMQDLTAAWKALRRMRETGLLPRLRIRFVGEVPSSLLRDLSTESLDDTVERTGLVTHREALRLMSESTVLLVAGTREPHPVFDGLMPAKMFEYLGTGLPIVYVGAPDADAGRLLARQPGCYVVEPSDTDGACSAFASLREQPLYARELEPFTRQALARRLASLLDAVTA